MEVAVTSVRFAYLCVFLMDLALMTFWVGLPYLVKDWFGAKVWQLGLMGTLGAASYVVMCMFAGRIAGRFKRHHLMAAGAMIVATAIALVALSWSIWVVMVLVILNGFGHGLFWPTVEAYLSDGAGPTELRHRIGWFNLSWSSGDVIGALLGGGLYGLARYLAGHTGQPWLQASPCLLISVIVLCIAVIALTRLRKAPERSSWRDKHDHRVPKSPGRGGHSSLKVFWLMALVANCTAMAFRAIMINIFPDFGKDLLHYSALQWGVLLAMTPLARTLMFVYWQRRHGWEYRARYLFGVQALLPLMAIVLIFNSSYWMFLVAFALAGVGMSKTYFASIFYSMDSDHSHEHRGGIHEAALGVGSMTSPLLAGVLASVSGDVRAPYVFISAVLVISMLIQMVMYLRSRTAKQ